MRLLIMILPMADIEAETGDDAGVDAGAEDRAIPYLPGMYCIHLMSWRRKSKMRNSIRRSRMTRRPPISIPSLPTVNYSPCQYDSSVNSSKPALLKRHQVFLDENPMLRLSRPGSVPEIELP